MVDTVVIQHRNWSIQLK